MRVKVALYAAVVAGKAYLLHRVGVPSEIAVPLSGGTTGVLWARASAKRRFERREL